MVAYTWLVPFLPLLAYVLLLIIGRRGREGVVTTISVLATLISFVISVVILQETDKALAPQLYVFHWLDVGTTSFSVGYEVNPLNAVMLVVVTFVSTLVLLFSKGYMHDDERFCRFYQYLSLFVFSMLGVVISPNLLQLYIFWELVGVCSYLLVGFWYFKPEAAAAAKKSFIVTRIGDVGLFVGVILLYLGTGSFDLHTIFTSISAGHIHLGRLNDHQFTTLCAILVFVGAIGKSAQFPLHVWLPDAMEGPTPVSALIHAATMVAAGVYLVGTTYPVFEVSGTALTVVGYVGGITALLGALIGITQTDIKRVIAYSTISQLGYMMLGLGAGSYVAGIFHLMTHAFFKALLFLAAGSVIHAVDSQDLKDMGGLFKKMPVTAWTFLAGALALSGIPPFAGFWSKDDILLGAYASGHTGLYWMGLIAAFFTAFYIFRVYFLTFAGTYRGEKHPHEGGWVMTLPLVVLGILATVAGFVNSPLTGNVLSNFLVHEGSHGFEYGTNAGLMAISSLVGLAGIALAATVYWGKWLEPAKLQSAFGPLHQLSYRKFYFDEMYDILVVAPVIGIARFCATVDRYVIDRIVGIVGEGTYLGSLALKVGQSGKLQTYSAITALGLFVLLVITALGSVIK